MIIKGWPHREQMPSSFSVFQLQMSSKRRDYLYRLRNSILLSDKTIRDGNNNKLSSFFLLELLIYDRYTEAIKKTKKQKMLGWRRHTVLLQRQSQSLMALPFIKKRKTRKHKSVKRTSFMSSQPYVAPYTNALFQKNIYLYRLYNKGPKVYTVA